MRSIFDLMNLEGKTAIVTGGNGWIGSAITSVLVELNANVIVVSRNSNHRQSEHAHGIINIDADLTRTESIDMLFNNEDVVRLQPSILVNNMCSWPTDFNFCMQSGDASA